MVRIIFDAGSCHEGVYDKAKQLAQVAKDAGAWAIKFQLFPNRAPWVPGNIPMPQGWLPMISQDVNIPVFASVFGDEAEMYGYIDYLIEMGAPAIKFAYSQRKNYEAIAYALLSTIPEVIVTTDVMGRHELGNNPKLTVLYTHTVNSEPQYPVTTPMDWAFLAPRYGFDGFSDHTLGINQSCAAINAGAKVIEKHLRLDDTPESIRDARFAILPADAKKLVAHA